MGDYPAGDRGKGRQVGYGESMSGGMADEKIRAVLERVAMRCCLATVGKVLPGDLAAVRFQLRESLLPLLLAGQAMHDAAPGTDFDRLQLAWDAALAAAQGQPEKSK